MKAFNSILFIVFFLVVVGFIGFQVYGQDILPSKDVQICIKELKEKLKRPMSFERKFGTTEVEPLGVGEIKFSYTVKNGFGNTVPGRVECWVSDGKVMLFKNYD